MIYSRTRRSIGRRAVLAGATLLPFSAVRAQGRTGVALVIGNSRYQWEAQLPNVRRDAPDMAKRFQALGLQTELLQDVGRGAMLQAIEKFKSAARGANFAALYFAGHGASWERNTYLVPVDADLSTPNTVQTLVPVPSVRQAMAEAAHRLLVLDNCRNNPADGWRQLAAERGASRSVDGYSAGAAARAPNTMVLFSTAPGRVALDGPAGQNSPFAAVLLRELEAPSIDLLALPAKLRRELLIATQGRQVLWDQSNYQQPFVLRGSGGGGAASRSGWASDPSKIIELHNAYAFAQQNGLSLPPGLIAHRPPNNSPDRMKVGSFQFVGTTSTKEKIPQILVVMSVEEQQTAELILAGKTGQGFGWSFRTGKLSGKRIEIVVRDGSPNMMFDWSDANSGSLSMLQGTAGRGGPGGSSAFNTHFSRLDG